VDGTELRATAGKIGLHGCDNAEHIDTHIAFTRAVCVCVCVCVCVAYHHIGQSDYTAVLQ